MHQKDRKFILEFKERIPTEIKKHIKKIVVFGSRATGRALDSSDLDVAVIVDKKSLTLEKKISDIVYGVMFDHDFKPIISLKVFVDSKFQKALKSGFSFYRHIDREGIVL